MHRRRRYIVVIGVVLCLFFVLALARKDGNYKAAQIAEESLPEDAETLSEDDAETLSEDNAEDVTTSTKDNVTRKDDPCLECSKLHNGILHRVTDPENFSTGCLVHAVLYCNSFTLWRGQTEVNTFDVKGITTPILLTPGSHLCFIVKEPSTAPEILCAENLNCRNEWWTALTRAVLCSHHGTKLRHEVAGEPILEEETEMIAEKVIEKPEQGGINLKFSGVAEMPIIKFKKPHKPLFK